MFSKIFVVFFSFLLLVAVTQVTASGASGASRLVQDLREDYNKIIYPDNITLQIGLTYVCAYMDEEHHILSSRVVERYHWVDNRLTWDPAKYEGVNKVSIPDKHIWIPDVHLQNAIMKEEVTEVNAIVHADGKVYWIPRVSYKTRCSDNDDHDDSYHCELKLGSWTYDANSIPLELFAGGFDTRLYLDTCPYTIDNLDVKIVNKKYECCPNPYATLNVEFDIQKKKEEKHDDDDDDDDADDHHHNGYKPRFSKDCVWPHCG